MSKLSFVRSLFGDLLDPKVAAAGAAGVAGTQSEEADAGLLNVGRRASTEIVDKIEGMRPPVVAEKLPGQHITDNKGRPIIGDAGVPIGKGKGTKYQALTAAQVDEAYKGLWKQIEDGPPKGFRDNKGNKSRRDGYLGPEARKKAWEHYSVQGFMHQMTDYERWAPIVRDSLDGGRSASDKYKLGMDAMYEEMIERAPEGSKTAVEGYFNNRIIKRKAGEVHDRYNPNKGNPPLDPIPGRPAIPDAPEAPKNSVMADALQNAGAAPEKPPVLQQKPAPSPAPSPAQQEKDRIAATLAEEKPTTGKPSKFNTGRPEVDRSGLKKGLLGSGAAGAAKSKAEEDESYLDTYFEDEYVPWEQIGGAGMPTPTWTDVLDVTGQIIDMPMSGLQGMARGAWGLLNGEDLATAGAEANAMMEGGADAGWDAAGDKVEEWAAPLGRMFPMLQLDKAAGNITRGALSLLTPF